MMAIRELMAGETALAYLSMAELRAGKPYLATREAFAAWVDARQRPEGYRLVASFADGPDEAAAVAGFRHLHALAWGDYLYVDDLITLPAFRGQGHADALFAWLRGEARRLGCAQVHLDSGVQRHTAHRFYLNHGFDITAHHFERSLGDR